MNAVVEATNYCFVSIFNSTAKLSNAPISCDHGPYGTGDSRNIAGLK